MIVCIRQQTDPSPPQQNKIYLEMWNQTTTTNENQIIIQFSYSIFGFSTIIFFPLVLV